MPWSLGFTGLQYKRSISSASAFVGIASESSRTYFSLDGITWNYGNPGNSVFMQGKTPTTFYGFYGNRFMTSTNRRNWSVVGRLASNESFTQIVYGASTARYVAIISDPNGNYFAYSSNGGVTWVKGEATDSNQIVYIPWGGFDSFIAVPSYLTGVSSFQRSSNGISWGSSDLGLGVATNYPKLVAANNTAFIFASGAFGSPTSTLFEINGSFEVTTRTIPTGRYANIAFGNGRYVMNDFYAPPSYNGVNVITSTNLSTWSARTTVGSGYGMAFPFLAFGGNRFIILPNYGDMVIHSTDGVSWSSTSQPAYPDPLYSVGRYFSSIQYQV